MSQKNKLSNIDWFINIRSSNNDSFNITIVALSAISLFITSLDMAIVNIAIPFITAAYKITPNQASLILLSYYLALSSMMIICGKLSDVIDIFVVLKIGCIIFLFGSILSGLALNLYFLVFFRFIQGIGGAILLPIHGSLIRKYLPHEKLGKYFGIMTFIAGLAFSLGYLCGGVLFEYLNWRWIFFINLPFGVWMLWLIRKISLNNQGLSLKLKNDNAPALINKSAANGHIISNPLSFKFMSSINIFNFDGIQNLSMAMVLFLLTYITNQLHVLALNLLLTLIVIVILLSIFLGFTILKSGIIASGSITLLSILTNKNILVALLLSFIMNVVFDGFNFVNPFYLNNIRHLQSTYMGLILTILPISAMIVGPFAGSACDRLGVRKVSILSVGLLIAALLVLANCDTNSSIAVIIVALVIFGVSIAMFFTANMHAVMLNASNGSEGVISALKASISYFGGVIGFSSFAQLLTADHELTKYTYNVEYLMHGFKNACLIGVILSLGMLLLCFLQKRHI